jgi:hypothetical protein
MVDHIDGVAPPIEYASKGEIAPPILVLRKSTECVALGAEGFG